MFSDPVFIRIAIAIVIGVIFILSIYLAWYVGSADGYFNGYSDCMKILQYNSIKRRRIKYHKLKPGHDIHVLPVNDKRQCVEAKSVRIVPKHNSLKSRYH